MQMGRWTCVRFLDLGVDAFVLAHRSWHEMGEAYGGRKCGLGVQFVRVCRRRRERSHRSSLRLQLIASWSCPANRHNRSMECWSYNSINTRPVMELRTTRL